MVEMLGQWGGLFLMKSYEIFYRYRFNEYIFQFMDSYSVRELVEINKDKVTYLLTFILYFI